MKGICLAGWEGWNYDLGVNEFPKDEDFLLIYSLELTYYYYNFSSSFSLIEPSLLLLLLLLIEEDLEESFLDEVDSNNYQGYYWASILY